MLYRPDHHLILHDQSAEPDHLLVELDAPVMLYRPDHHLILQDQSAEPDHVLVEPAPPVNHLRESVDRAAFYSLPLAPAFHAAAPSELVELGVSPLPPQLHEEWNPKRHRLSPLVAKSEDTAEAHSVPIPPYDVQRPGQTTERSVPAVLFRSHRHHPTQ